MLSLFALLTPPPLPSRMGVLDLLLRYVTLLFGFPTVIGLIAVLVAWIQCCAADFSLTCLLLPANFPPNQDWWWWFVNFVSPAAITAAIIVSVSIQTNGFTTRADGVPVARKVTKSKEIKVKAKKPKSKKE